MYGTLGYGIHVRDTVSHRNYHISTVSPCTDPTVSYRIATYLLYRIVSYRAVFTVIFQTILAIPYRTILIVQYRNLLLRT